MYKGTRLCAGDPKFGYEKGRGVCYIKEGEKIFHYANMRWETYTNWCGMMRMEDPELHKIKHIVFEEGLTDAQIQQARKFIYPEEKENNKPARVYQDLIFDPAHYTCLKSQAAVRSHAKPKSTVFQESGEGPNFSFLPVACRNASGRFFWFTIGIDFRNCLQARLNGGQFLSNQFSLLSVS